MQAFQDLYPADLSHCYGCGKNNPHGHQLKSFWDDDETIALFTPKPFHTAIPGFVYGGLIASLIDCHGTGSASAAAGRAFADGTQEAPRFVTAALNIDYLAPTPMGVELELRGVIREVKPNKVVLDISLIAAGVTCAKGHMVAVKMPTSMMGCPL
ncbi:Thioesterase superfamily member [Shewanella piezotolerans WP3]|uniref:Thioesterase superfamily member n=1 Tax=Shewanella piezotolerans (strain WP3 / JCM 13877) TaxID=225849 RepID=B8CGY8_SHEPW|nr:PaaI family thioesterase [Shewanella piezotolerans]ACJ26981.1 Thioesterase superfamily member [Shewanella piezotolerans WP3]